jgi:PIN domain nuclease of toxin-antitoxin system
MTVTRVLLDTSYLITLVNSHRVNHLVARAYYRHMIENEIQMCVSAIAVSEYAVKDSISTLPQATNFIFLPFNATDGIESARLHKAIIRDPGDDRQSVKDDVKLLGHGEHEKIPFVLTDDKKTMYKYCERLRNAGVIKLKPIALVDGFDACAFRLDGQTGFGFEDR